MTQERRLRFPSFRVLWHCYSAALAASGLVLVEYQDRVSLVFLDSLMELLKLKCNVQRAGEPQIPQRIGIISRKPRAKAAYVNCGDGELMLSIADPFAELPDGNASFI